MLIDKFKKFVKKYFSSFAFFYSYLRNKIFIVLFLSIAVSFLDGIGLTMFIPLLQVVDSSSSIDASEMGKLGLLVEGMQNIGIPMELVWVLVIMLVFFCLKGVAVYINSIYKVIIKQHFIKQIRLNLLNRLNRMSFKNFITSDVGRIQNTMTGEVDRVSNAFSSYFSTAQQAVMILVYMSFAVAADPQFAVFVALGGILTNVLYKFIYKRTKGASQKLTRYNSVYQGQIIQHVGHFKYLKTTGAETNYGDKLKGTIDNIEKSRRKIGFLAAISSAAREPLLVGVIVVIIYVQIQFFGGTMAAILISLVFFYRALTALVNMQENWNRFLEMSGSLENLQDFQKHLERSYEKDGKKTLQSFDDKIALNQVDFYYGDTQILNKINLNIVKNESIAFVGESGSGKTTLVNLIAGLMPPNGGKLTVDGMPLEEYKRKTYQSRLGYVSQDPVIFNDTIYNNVTFWDQPTQENIQRFEKAVAQASLAPFLAELPEGKQTYLGNNGLNLSGGQKQRISIARELYKQIDILILDEATSALDSETEKEIQASIDALQGEYTIIIVAHRLATIKNADRIVFMEKGNILDIDNFANLVQKQERFRKMVELQEL